VITNDAPDNKPANHIRVPTADNYYPNKARWRMQNFVSGGSN